MMNLDEGVKVAKIAKVREKLSNSEQEIDDIEEIMENVAEDSVETDISGEESTESIEETEVYIEDAAEGSVEENDGLN